MKKSILFLSVALLFSACDDKKHENKAEKVAEKHKLFVVASDQEVDINKFEVKQKLYDDAYLTDVGYIIFTGIGKVKTAYSLTKFLTLYKDNVSGIYNIGTAGATENNKFADMIECNRFVQNDYMNHDPNSRVDITKTKTLLEENNDYTCLTTDSFITKKHKKGKFVFEMEAYANAEVAKNFGLLEDFHAIKFVSDIVGADKGGHWEKDAATLNNKLVNKIKDIANNK